ncbi:MAG TPA: bifunctional glutamate N-acetyltransferase/amino-acid acetyltransferase ArgJ [Vicinamibacterales bacterium]|nr:bifunctional glutamate N-acetyltransferase/amino-acid acetyltransferase ArgJ [Vicinamibacterales bacterium]
MAAAIPGGVTAAEGFSAAGVHCGIKPSALDLAVIAADRPATAAALFTTNLVKAAPVLLSQQHVRASGGRARAVVINSGCANACTGAAGLEVAQRTAAHASAALGVPPEHVLVASTGVIGVALDAERVKAGISAAISQLSRDAHLDAARAIMTTDRGPKEAAVEARAGGQRFRVGGLAKGAGMIEPNMATMLAVLTTDAAVEAPLLDRALRAACAETFNAITIDGDTSTNDTVFALASGAGGAMVGDEELPAFQAALTDVCRGLAIAIVRGGEGVTRTVSVRVSGAPTVEQARRVAKTVANSLLVKTAIHGADPNWGRILAAAGRAGVPFDPRDASVRIGPVVLFAGGRPFDDRAPQAAGFLSRDEVEIEVGLGAGSAAAIVYTCDLSAEYVRINAEYRT